MAEQQAGQTTIRLRCCNGEPAPPDLIEGWQRFVDLPEHARKTIWMLLGPALMNPGSPLNRELQDMYCNDNELRKEDVGAAVQACEFMLRGASALDLEKQDLAQDMAALSNGTASGEVILAQYDTVKVDLRRQIVQASLADHGKVLVGIGWRLDQMSGSDRGVGLNQPVVFLTLNYREGAETGRVALQLTPEALQELKRFTERFSSTPVG